MARLLQSAWSAQTVLLALLATMSQLNAQDRYPLDRVRREMSLPVPGHAPARAGLPRAEIPAPVPVHRLPPVEAAAELPVELERLPPVEEETLPSREPVPLVRPVHQPQATEDLAWWDSRVNRPLRGNGPIRDVDVTGLVIQALSYSEHLQALRQIPLAEAENIVRAEAEFDPQTYLENRLDYLNKPVGNTLTTGGPSRLLQPQWDTTGGVRRKAESGASVDLSQRLGLNTSNSVFQSPVNQGTTELAIRLNQPLLRGRGAEYNRGAIILAQLNTRIAEDRLARDVQDHLLKVNKAYWELYLERTNLLQQQRHLGRAQEILRELEARQALDATLPQILRARSAVTSRQSDLARAQAAIRISEARIRSLTNSPQTEEMLEDELIPVQAPLTQIERVDLRESLAVAARRRPEVDEALRQVDAARVRLDLSRNELMPSLNLVLEAYARGLQGGFDVPNAYARQWDTGGPSTTAGLLFEMPWGNRAAIARERQKQFELTQMTRTFRATLSSLSFEVEAAVCEVQATHQEGEAKRTAVLATRRELEASEHRWRLLAGDDRSATFLLDDIFNAQDRLREEERALAQAVVAYNLSLAQWRRSIGNLVDVQLLTRGNCDP